MSTQRVVRAAVLPGQFPFLGLPRRLHRVFYRCSPHLAAHRGAADATEAADKAHPGWPGMTSPGSQCSSVSWQWSHPATHSHNSSSGFEFYLNSWYPRHVGECAGVLSKSNSLLSYICFPLGTSVPEIPVTSSASMWHLKNESLPKINQDTSHTLSKHFSMALWAQH